ncbi:hypothetical protein LVY72_12355 [Arthrobacter sp. I2-34]|uniref:Uncharacterized protein n=1 Tax=Arthrobacter hankyongi TaxID=2904801 RepID=A0ABS9L7N7_9MICC|nr:hypothetical protein [Arthrobacter hankyongi]MCG2622695.1 hypothetical protein [Arthrobacter hankyongi]
MSFHLRPLNIDSLDFDDLGVDGKDLRLDGDLFYAVYILKPDEARVGVFKPTGRDLRDSDLLGNAAVDPREYRRTNKEAALAIGVIGAKADFDQNYLSRIR